GMGTARHSHAAWATPFDPWPRGEGYWRAALSQRLKDPGNQNFCPPEKRVVPSDVVGMHDRHIRCLSRDLLCERGFPGPGATVDPDDRYPSSRLRRNYQGQEFSDRDGRPLITQNVVSHRRSRVDSPVWPRDVLCARTTRCPDVADSRTARATANAL